ncbi:MAG: hypothetical protein ABJA20_06570 [Novosphingobium sp.]
MVHSWCSKPGGPVTREGSAKWTEGMIAARLAQALFAEFPGKSGETKTALR